ncbi:MAG: glycerophosphodiester phosphodiesterase family protein [Bacteroidota bacterium]
MPSPASVTFPEAGPRFGNARRPRGGDLGAMLALAFLLAVTAADSVLVIAHRGASGDLPEHTLEAYRLAVEHGADVIEPDVVATRDGVLIARHENEISETTDVAARVEFAGRRTTKTIDGREVTGWFTEDFTLAEIKTLRAVERLPDLRPESAAYDGRFEIPTLAEVIDLARRLGAERGRPVGLYPETKHPTYFRQIGLPLDEPLVALLHEAGYTSPADPVWIQSFEAGNLRRLRGLTDLRLVFLAYPGGAPFDAPAETYDALLAPDRLGEVAAFADALGVHKRFVLTEAGADTGFAEAARAAGLDVHVWTVRAENAFLLPPFRLGDDPAPHGDHDAVVRALAEAGVDGVFTDHTRLAVEALR